MKISYNWLKDYLDIKVTPEKLADDLSLFGHEAESIKKIGDDTVLDLEITPNRGDCLSILGIARETAALYRLKIKDQRLKIKIKDQKLEKNIKVKVSSPKICPRFTARIIDGIKIGESPKWMQKRLAAYGFRPINNIVDITNYVMIATGQPLHAFDYDKISQQSAGGSQAVMNVRQAKKAPTQRSGSRPAGVGSEELMTLDGVNRVLPEGAIVIEDREKIYDLAGIMGGFKSEVDKNTKTIILQGAIFDPVLIRKTSKYLNHTTDASYRYERGVDFEGTITGVNLATKLILDSCKDAKAGELIDEIYSTKGGSTSGRQKQKEIPFKIGDINQLLGTNITINKAEEYLERLNIKVENITNDGKAESIAIPPSYRAYDITIWQDIAEEVARMKGYNDLGAENLSKKETKIHNNRYILEEVLRDIIADSGYTEVLSYSFADKKLLEGLGMFSGEILEIEKPLSPETRYLRPDLLPSALTQIAKNPWAPEVKIFEIGDCFRGGKEFTQVIIAQTGKNKKELENVINIIKEKLGVDQIEYEIIDIDQKILDLLKIRKKVIVIRIDFEKLLEMVGDIVAEFELPEEKFSDATPTQGRSSDKVVGTVGVPSGKYKNISKFAPTIRDLAFIVSDNVKVADVTKDIKSIDSEILLVELFDEFSSEKFGAGKKNIAYHIWMEDPQKPMDEKQVERIVNNIIEKISKDYNAQIRR